MSEPKSVKIIYYAQLREQRELSSEEVETCAANLSHLYETLKSEHSFSLPEDQLRVAVNDEFCGFDQLIKSGDKIVFVPPVAGG
ncbi:hypothetical protein MNBD_BACTEROID05-822 [hydrothermal vent metagenome]|uniref:Molybdopterin synthase sulfur carrier subunit n=1 Tax=hydrothermal vent metagenome TaxID=652676 RepID=A0A3B0T4Q8_9ZZZZ